MPNMNLYLQCQNIDTGSDSRNNSELPEARDRVTCTHCWTCIFTLQIMYITTKCSDPNHWILKQIHHHLLWLIYSTVRTFSWFLTNNDITTWQLISQDITPPPTGLPPITLTEPSYTGVYNVDVGRVFQLACIGVDVISYRVLNDGTLMEIDGWLSVTHFSVGCNMPGYVIPLCA